MSRRARTSSHRTTPTSESVLRPLCVIIAICVLSLATACEPQDEAAPPDPPPQPADTEDVIDDPSPPAPQGLEPEEHSGVPLDFSDNVASVRPAVVNIYTRSDPPEPPAPSTTLPPGMVPEQRVQESLGSGFIFDDQGLVLTNHHVIAEASEIAVRLLDERVYSAEVVGSDPPTDVAVLRLELDDDDDPVPTVSLGDSDKLEVGNWIIVIGNPLGLASTVTAGIASATGRQLMPPGGQLRFQDFIQTDASINPGSSGGPLVNTSSEVMGIATAVTTEAQGLGFAIPINMVHEILDDLIETGRVERSWLGVYIGEVPSRLRDELDLPDQGGAMVTRLVEDGPAEDAGLEPADVIIEIDEREVDNATHLAWLAATIGVGEEVDIRLWRGDEEMTLPMVMGTLPVAD